MYESMYGLNHSIKSFAVANEFVSRLNTGCYQMGKNLQPFCFFASDLQKQWGVVDIGQFSGFVNNEISLIKEISGYRRELYTNTNFGLLPYGDNIDKVLFYDYLLSVSICYIEVPRITSKNGVSKKTYDKFLATRNPFIMSAWMGFPASEMQSKYSTRIEHTNADFITNMVRVAKLSSSAKGNTITIPRSNFDVTEMTCIPLFMLYAMVNGFYSNLKDGIVKFTYLKDNDTVRELPSTVNFDILIDYYKDNNFITGMLQGVDVFTEDQGGMLLSSKQSRGYIKLPELGCSRFDYTGVRSLNISRILRMESISEVDRSFIDVDLNIVVSEFKNKIDSLLLTNPSELINVLDALCQQHEVDRGTSPALLTTTIKDYVDTCDIMLSTQFRRALHTFMISNPQWFGNYTGISSTGSVSVVSSKNCGIETMNF